MNEQELQMAGQEQKLFDGKKLLSRVIDYWYLYVICLIVCISYAWFKLHYATPMYKVYGQVIVQDDKSSGNSQALSGGGMDISSLFSGKVNMENELAIFQTPNLCLKVARNPQFYIFYYHRGSVRTVELYKDAPFTLFYHPLNDTIAANNFEIKFPTQFGNRFTLKMGGKSFQWTYGDTLHYRNADYVFQNKGQTVDTTASYIIQIQNPRSVAGTIAGSMGTSLLSTKSTIISLVYSTNLPQKGEDVLNEVMNAYVNRNLEQKNVTSDSTIQFINSRIALVGADLSNIESTIQRFKEENKIADLSAQSEQLISNSGEAYQKLSDIDVQLQVMQTMLQYIENEQNNRRPVPALINGDGTFSGLVSAYNAAQVQRDKLLLSLREDNPIAGNLDVQIAGIRGDLIRSLKSQQKALTISRQTLVAQNNLYSSEIRGVPQKERTFLDYSREQTVKQALYLFLLQRREEIAIAKASNASNASIISPARASYVPYEPVASTSLIIGSLIGLLIPTGFVMLKYLLNNKVQERDDVTNQTPTTILSEIGHSQEEGLLDIKAKGRSVSAEQFRIFRTNMDFAIQSKPSPVILITSCLSGEGKTFIAANLAQIYAVSGKRVLLMELDLRRPKLSKMLNMTNDTGFSNYMISNTPIEAFIKPVKSTSSDSLFLLPSGPIPPNPAELLLSDKLKKLMEKLKQDFDLIVIDTAPIGAVTDAQILGSVTDISLYIIRQGYSIKSSIGIINDIIINKKLPSLYVVMNDMREGASYRYGYGYKYGYGYGYGGYTERNKRNFLSRIFSGRKS